MTLDPTGRWHDEVPGTRWFRADLHLHTIDDPYVELPPGIVGNRDDPDVLRAYARRFLDAAVEQGIEVLGLTPHAASVKSGVSATWTIVETWEEGIQVASGRAYRDLIYAVYAGFEPSFADGNNGIHLIFLFDPKIGKEVYLNTFSAVMDGRPAYDGRNLNQTLKSPKQVFSLLDDRLSVGKGNYLVVAAHPLQSNGLLSRPGHYISDLAGGHIQAAELRRDKTIMEDLADNTKLQRSFNTGRIALYHSSDAVKLASQGIPPLERALGHRFVQLKLASPTLEALRQALLGRDSRLRIPYIRDSAGRLVIDPALPVALPHGAGARPWIREIRIQGGTSFLRDQTFRLSPDLTCVIGGSMTGKSTLLDGLRLWMGGDGAMPDRNTTVGRDALSRARDRFLSGNPTINLESPAGDLARPVAERVSPRFFSQGELKSLADDDEGIEHLLFHLVPGRASELFAQRNELLELDQRLTTAVGRLARLQEQVAEADQEFRRAASARAAMKQFEQAGTDALPPAQQDAARSATFLSDIGARAAGAKALAAEIASLTLPSINSEPIAENFAPLAAESAMSAAGLLATAVERIEAVVGTLAALETLATSANQEAISRLSRLTEEIQAALVAAGRSASDLNEFDAYARAAQHYDSFKAVVEEKQEDLTKARNSFDADSTRRDALVTEHREAIQGICNEVEARFGGRVLVAIDEEGRRGPLESWILGLKHQGMTRWWNGDGARSATATALRELVTAIASKKDEHVLQMTKRLGMSDAIARTVLEHLAPWKRQLEIWALRNPDRYRIQWVEDGQTKDLSKLSGGRRVAVLLSLILESDDSTPLFVDQPEDELDNRFLNDTIIPALHRLKGKRQVVFATHSANLVVNGDADQVIALEADAERGRIDVCGAIEVPDVRDAIVRTLDGGADAFRLRRKKYGY
jgi:hypothetical protein